MIRSTCIQAVATALGRQPTQAELKDLETRLSEAMRRTARADPVLALSQTPAQRLSDAAKLAAKEIAIEAAKKKQRVALTIQAHDRLQTYLKTHPTDMLTALDELIAFSANRKGSAMSVETRADAIKADAERQLIDLWKQTKATWLGLGENKEKLDLMTRAIFGEKTGHADVDKAAEAWRKVTDFLRERYNAAGGVIGKIVDWGMPHHHSSRKVAAAGRDKWIDDILPLVSRDRYVNEDGSRMTDPEMREFLGEAWLSIASQGANKMEPGRVSGTGMRANRHAEERQIHFRDADSYLAYQKQYGEQGLRETLAGHIGALSKDLAAIEMLGPNPDNQFAYWRDVAQQEAATTTPTDAGKITERVQTMTKLYNAVSGKSEPIANQSLSRWADNLRSLLIASRLGSALISSMSDVAMMHTTANVNGISHVQLFRNQLAALNIADRTEMRLARRTGLALDTLIGSMNRSGQDYISGLPHRLAEFAMRASFLNTVTEARQRAFGVAMMDALGSMTREKEFADLDPADHKILLSKGVTETDWSVWKKAILEDFGHGNEGVLSPDAIAAIPDAELAGLGDPAAIRREAMLKLLGTVREEMNMAVIVPGARERAIAGGGQQKGTWRGELVRSIFLFKSFPIAMMMRSVGRARTMGAARGSVYLASLVASTTLLGALSVQTNEVISGRDPRAMGNWRFWIASMLKGGSLGLYGDFLFSQSSQHGGSATSSLLGPSVGLLEEALNLTQGNMVEMMQGKDTHVGAEFVKFIKGITPGTSLWYAKAALDHMIFQKLQEHFSPGYLAKIKARARNEFKQEYWWEPGRTEPRRGPDMKRALK